MPIVIPNLDDQTYEGLINEMIQSIPHFSSSWTNFNPSDPGITLLELLCYITESLVYRTNQISEKTYFNFLRLIAGTEQYDPTDNLQACLLEEVKKWEQNQEADFSTIKAMVQRYWVFTNRTISVRDFYALALEAYFMVDTSTSASNINYRELDLEYLMQIRRVIIDPDNTTNKINVLLNPASHLKISANQLILFVKNYLIPKRPIGTIINVQLVDFTCVELAVKITTANFISEKMVYEHVNQAVAHYLSSTDGGSQQTGWPMGQALIIFDLLRIVEDVEGVEKIENITLNNYTVIDKHHQPNSINAKQFKMVTDFLTAVENNQDNINELALQFLISVRNKVHPPLLAIVSDKKVAVIQKRTSGAERKKDKGRIPFTKVFVPELIKLEKKITFESQDENVLITYVDLFMRLLIDKDQPSEIVEDAVRLAIESYLSSTEGGSDHTGWPLGQALVNSDLLSLVKKVKGVKKAGNICLNNYRMIDKWRRPATINPTLYTLITDFLSQIEPIKKQEEIDEHLKNLLIQIGDETYQPFLVIDTDGKINVVHKMTELDNHKNRIPFTRVFVPGLIKLDSEIEFGKWLEF